MTEALGQAPGSALFEREAQRIASCCEAMAERFARGGGLFALAAPADHSDARHVAVEFAHPVIVGKRALPAVALPGGTAPDEVDQHVGAADIALGLAIGEGEGAVADVLGRAADRGALTICIGAGAGDWSFELPGQDPLERQELAETLYHVLWELVHVFIEAEESSALLPFMRTEGGGTGELREAAATSALAKGRTAAELRGASMAANAGALESAAGALRNCFASGGRLLAFGNGGSATDAEDVTWDLRERGLPALDLASDPGIITAVANDVGAAEIFSRQVIAYARPGDTALAISTSGSSENLIRALTEARGRSLTTLAVLGYDGGRIATEGLADHALIVDSQEIPRIQEAQGTLLHELVRRCAA